MLHLTLIGGPTVLIEFDGVRLLTDPTFDEPGSYPGAVTLTKTAGPALSAAEVGDIDAVLLSHDQHSDNLDRSGRTFLAQVPRVLTTEAGAKRLGANAIGLAPWQKYELKAKNGLTLRIAATPARHGPAGIEPISGDVIGFVVGRCDGKYRPIYVTGDTVWYEGVAEVANRFPASIVLLFAGSAQARGPFNLTMNTNDAIETARAFPRATIVPVHQDSWAHFTQSAEDIAASFKTLGIGDRLKLIEPGVRTEVPLRQNAS
jgi:L-ascorbate metabolism protein UlaG (beta-lactamase superfamily)